MNFTVSFYEEANSLRVRGELQQGNHTQSSYSRVIAGNFLQDRKREKQRTSKDTGYFKKYLNTAIFIITVYQEESRTDLLFEYLSFILLDVSLRGKRKFLVSTKKSEMGTEEKDSEPAAQPPVKEQGTPEKENESPVEPPQGQTSEATDPLNTYKWHTGSKGTLNEVKEGDGAAAPSTSTLDRLQKASTNKWNKMQSWRKALSEDPGDKSSASGKGGEGTKPEKAFKVNRKNPFRRALSEPPGSLFAARSPSSNTASTANATSSSAAAETSGAPSTDPAQKGGGGKLLQKYFRAVSQKIKRPKLQSQSSSPTLLQGNTTLYLHCTFTLGLNG